MNEKEKKDPKLVRQEKLKAFFKSEGYLAAAKGMIAFQTGLLGLQGILLLVAIMLHKVLAVYHFIPPLIIALLFLFFKDAFLSKSYFRLVVG